MLLYSVASESHSQRFKTYQQGKQVLVQTYDDFLTSHTASNDMQVETKANQRKCMENRLIPTQRANCAAFQMTSLLSNDSTLSLLHLHLLSHGRILPCNEGPRCLCSGLSPRHAPHGRYPRPRHTTGTHEGGGGSRGAAHASRQVPTACAHGRSESQCHCWVQGWRGHCGHRLCAIGGG